MLCPNCGNELPDNAVLCTECGHMFANTAEPTGIATEIPSVVESKPVKKSRKKAVIITSAVVAGAVAVGVPVFLAVKNNSEQQYIRENPTKYLVGSAVKYFDVEEKDNGIYHFAKGVYQSGGLKFTYNAQDTDISAYFGYDADKKQAFADISGKANVMGSEQTASIKSYIDTDSFNIDYDVTGSQGSYFIDLKNLKQDFADSVFADKNSSLYNEQFEKMIDQFDKSYDTIQDDKQMKQDFENTISQICKSFETNGHAEVKSEKVAVAEKDYSADLITYDFKAADISLFIDDCKNYFVEYVTKYKDSIFKMYDDINVSAEDMEKQIKSAAESMKSSIPQDIEMKYECFISSDDHQLLKVVYTQTETGNMGKVSIELPHDSEIVYNIVVSSSGDKYVNSESNYTLVRKATDDSLTYRFVSAEKDKPMSTFALEYNKKDSKLYITNLADISEQPVEMTLTELLSGITSASTANFTVTLDFECTDDKVSIGDKDWKLELSATPDIKPFKAEKNFFKLTEEEIQEALPNVFGVTGVINNAEKAQKQTNAAMLDAACKRLYAGTVSGSLNSATSPSELGNLDAGKLPAPNATVAERREIANELTIQDAIDYGYLTDTFADESPYDYAYSMADGTIIYFDENADYETYDLVLGFEYTTLGDLYAGE